MRMYIFCSTVFLRGKRHTDMEGFTIIHFQYKKLQNTVYKKNIKHFYIKKRNIGVPGQLSWLSIWLWFMILRFTGSSPTSGSVLTAQSLEPASNSVSPSLWDLKFKNFKVKKKKKRNMYTKQTTAYIYRSYINLSVNSSYF